MMSVEEIVTRAIPKEDCPVKESGAEHRREQLKKRIEDKLKERDKTEPYKPDLEYKGYPNKGNPPGLP